MQPFIFLDTGQVLLLTLRRNVFEKQLKCCRVNKKFFLDTKKLIITNLIKGFKRIITLFINFLNLNKTKIS